MPRVDRLTLAVVTAVPEWHPEHRNFEPFPVHAWVIRHPEGAILVDTGIGPGNPFIDELYRPRIRPLAAALGGVDLEPSDIVAVVLSHLHFDHCGQQDALRAPVYVQAAEHEAARAQGYTVPEWAAISDERLRLVGGDDQIAEGIRLLSTPGHTPGHQSVVIETAAQRVVLAAQCAYRAHEVRSGEPSESNLHDDAWRAVARRSLHRLQELAPVTIELSHDPEVVLIPG
ncbi:MAG: N-acyl homoserine lactone hydrolase [Actinomycetota bacterium]|jgi:glyoxylase-like metal-dependent hydrolase (beta-lactamase superfamily II)|nr:N-acyl homoserine lactone hydrolase [Actinomycetota bacterium]